MFFGVFPRTIQTQEMHELSANYLSCQDSAPPKPSDALHRLRH